MLASLGFDAITPSLMLKDSQHAFSSVCYRRTRRKQPHKTKLFESRSSCSYSPNTMNRNIKILCLQKKLKEAMEIFEVMQNSDIAVEKSTYARLIQSCADLKALQHGTLIHTHILFNALAEDVYLNSKLLNMYVKLARLIEARAVFDQVPKRTRFFWNMMIRAYSIHGLYQQTLLLYEEMLLDGVQPNRFTFPFVLKACACTGALDVGIDIHNYAIDVGLLADVYTGRALVDMYVKCGCLEDARNVFDKMTQ